ncbi:haloalkane dehalogenase [Pseudoalteromonas luteoviolacea]|uniref:haloalkane dehalogenase n=1 Tax=Pseudoalteromonas luteoviolacea TaxID=43657 RepID=UPI001B36B91E|nr:haloalkane dehalogenase [Pseudoalteromonas luteoviolacea]MBQ4834874.1 haloalkane dehalogenase [Pseudoalteromonas luteoviolacea]
MTYARILLLTLLGVSTPSMATSNVKLPLPVIAETHDIEQHSIAVKGSKMAYLEQGEGKAVVFVHGNPTSSYSWRNVMPYISDTHRAIAVDLIGMGDSGKPDIEYTFKQQYQYFNRFINRLNLDEVILVGHDWGAAIAWLYAKKNPDKVDGLAFMEGVLPPQFPAESYEDLGSVADFFRTLRDPVVGPMLIIEQNMWIEQALPASVNRTLGEQAMEAYRAPYLVPESRKPLLAWPNQLPIAREPAQTDRLMRGIKRFMGKTDMPILYIYGSPSVDNSPQVLKWYVENIDELETAYVGQGLHYLPEDQPDAIGRALEDWLRRLND